MLSPLHRPITEPGGAFLCRFIRLVRLFCPFRTACRLGAALTRRIGHAPALAEKRRLAGDFKPGLGHRWLAKDKQPELTVDHKQRRLLIWHQMRPAPSVARLTASRPSWRCGNS